MALTPAEKQKRYRDRYRDRPSPAQEIKALKARVAELESQIQGAAAQETPPLQMIDNAIIDQWEQALGRKKRPQ
jgi:cell division septum initiation protein DivIVA